MCSGGKAPKVAPAVEPAKSVEQNMASAGGDAQRKQALRAGFSKFYTRDYAGAFQSQTSGVSSKSESLGG